MPTVTTCSRGIAEPPTGFQRSLGIMPLLSPPLYKCHETLTLSQKHLSLPTLHRYGAVVFLHVLHPSIANRGRGPQLQFLPQVLVSSLYGSAIPSDNEIKMDIVVSFQAT